jgi:hypothetical protein
MKNAVLSATTPSIVVRYVYFGIAFCLRRKDMTVTDIKPFVRI